MCDECNKIIFNRSASAKFCKSCVKGRVRLQMMKSQKIYYRKHKKAINQYSIEQYKLRKERNNVKQ